MIIAKTIMDKKLYPIASPILPLNKLETPRVIPTEKQYFPNIIEQIERLCVFSIKEKGKNANKINIIRNVKNLYLSLLRLIIFKNNLPTLTFLPIGFFH